MKDLWCSYSAAIITDINECKAPIHIRLCLNYHASTGVGVLHVLGDLIIPADFLSMSNWVVFKAGELMFRWLWGAVAQWSEHLQLKQEALHGFNSRCYTLGFFLFHLAH